MKTTIFFCFLITVLLINGCITEFVTKLPEDYNEILIVDGNITENSEVIFHLSKSYSMNSPYIPSETLIADAKLTMISSSEYESPPAIYAGMGEYRLSVGELDDNVNYGIRIEYDGDVYQSTLSKPLHTPEIDSVSFNQPEDYGSVIFNISTHDDSNEARFYLWNYTETWEFNAFYYNTAFIVDKNKDYVYVVGIDPAPYFNCWRTSISNSFLVGSTEKLNENTITNKQLFQRGALEDRRFSLLYCLDVNQKALSEEAYDYYLNKIKLNDEMGGLFTPQPSELYGNISCITDPSKKVIGYVEISKNITQKRIWVYPYQIKIPFDRDCSDVISTGYIRQIMKENGYEIDYFLERGYVPMGEYSGEIPVIWEGLWTQQRCTNCILDGGTQKRPDFWPNNHE